MLTLILLFGFTICYILSFKYDTQFILSTLLDCFPIIIIFDFFLTSLMVVAFLNS